MRRWFELGWLAILLLLVGYELLAVAKHTTQTPTLTELVVKISPPELTLAFLTWLWLHFAIRYFKRGF